MSSALPLFADGRPLPFVLPMVSDCSLLGNADSYNWRLLSRAGDGGSPQEEDDDEVFSMTEGRQAQKTENPSAANLLLLDS
jgi:hypothetical protein